MDIIVYIIQILIFTQYHSRDSREYCFADHIHPKIRTPIVFHSGSNDQYVSCSSFPHSPNSIDSIYSFWWRNIFRDLIPSIHTNSFVSLPFPFELFYPSKKCVSVSCIKEHLCESLCYMVHIQNYGHNARNTTYKNNRHTNYIIYYYNVIHKSVIISIHS